jgi:hypothetical protein
MRIKVIVLDSLVFPDGTAWNVVVKCPTCGSEREFETELEETKGTVNCVDCFETIKYEVDLNTVK